MQDVKSLERKILQLKSEFSSSYKGSAHLYEVLPMQSSEILQDDLDALHLFAQENPMYTKWYESSFADTKCTVYEGDMNSYWLDSIKHDTSYAPFYPTWILSAYALSQQIVKMGIKHALDIGSGDGRIAYCCQMAQIDTYSVEIDENLVALQRKMCEKTSAKFDVRCEDATKMDYSNLRSKRVSFFIGGLPEVGEILAKSVIEKTIHMLDPVYVLAGTLAPRKSGREASVYGWGPLLEEFGLEVSETLILPTRWTVDQVKDTPYVFVVPKDVC